MILHVPQQTLDARLTRRLAQVGLYVQVKGEQYYLYDSEHNQQHFMRFVQDRGLKHRAPSEPA